MIMAMVINIIIINMTTIMMMMMMTMMVVVAVTRVPLLLGSMARVVPAIHRVMQQRPTNVTRTAFTTAKALQQKQQ